MDNKVKNNNNSFGDDHDFLLDNNFISWRLFRTKESDEYWNNILIENPNLERVINEAIRQFEAVNINKSELPENDKRNIYRNVQEEIQRYKRRIILRKISSAVAVLVIGVLFVIFFTHKEKGESVARQDNEVIIGQSLPQEEIYLISGGEKINITHKSHIGLTGGGKALVTDSVDSSKELILTTTELNKLIVPFGKRINLTLSDGTIVWLNSGTQLDFPAVFTGNKREVRVNGEIFIDVAHNPEIPFVVHAGDIEIHVQGTSFNISAYHDDNSKTIVLVDGSVRVETNGRPTTELRPNEKIEITGVNISKESVDVSEYISWTRGVLEFNETPVSEILKKIGRYYNVQFESSHNMEFSDKTCSGKLFLSNNLDSVMTSVSEISSFIYKRENNIIHITKK